MTYITIFAAIVYLLRPKNECCCASDSSYPTREECEEEWSGRDY